MDAHGREDRVMYGTRASVQEKNSRMMTTDIVDPSDMVDPSHILVDLSVSRKTGLVTYQTI